MEQMIAQPPSVPKREFIDTTAGVASGNGAFRATVWQPSSLPICCCPGATDKLSHSTVAPLTSVSSPFAFGVMATQPTVSATATTPGVASDLSRAISNPTGVTLSIATVRKGTECARGILAFTSLFIVCTCAKTVGEP